MLLRRALQVFWWVMGAAYGLLSPFLWGFTGGTIFWGWTVVAVPAYWATLRVVGEDASGYSRSSAEKRILICWGGLLAAALFILVWPFSYPERGALHTDSMPNLIWLVTSWTVAILELVFVVWVSTRMLRHLTKQA